MKWALNLIILFLLISCTPVFAAVVCTNEPDVSKSTSAKAVYMSTDQWQAAYDDLLTMEPASPSSFDTYYAWTIYRNHRAQSQKFKRNRDKKQHCFMGCLMANQINHETAAYMAWYKEYRDITDCNSKTNFDLLDITATLQGADFGATDSKFGAQVCFDWCAENIVKKK